VQMMRMVKSVMTSAIAGVLLFGLSGTVIAKDKFEKEVDNEKAAVKLVREVQRGGYGVMTAEAVKEITRALPARGLCLFCRCDSPAQGAAILDSVL